MKHKGSSVSVSVKDTDVFKDAINIIKDILDDHRVPDEVKQEIKEKLQRMVIINSYETGA